MLLVQISKHRRFINTYKSIFNNCCRVRFGSTDVLYTLLRRGVVKEFFPKDANIKISGLPCAYAGFDATSDSLHLGNLLVLIALIHWQRAGNQAIVLIGDSTALVGDPSGHKYDRDVLASGFVANNAKSIEKSISRILENHKKYIWQKKFPQKNDPLPIKLFRNSSWYKDINVIDIMSTAGKNIRLGEMLSRTSVRSRVDGGEGMNFSEFSYQLFQSYDWLHLLNKYNCMFQIGGSDQLGNIVTGYQLISNIKYMSVYGVLLPLVESESGDKYGKTGAGNPVFLNSDKTSFFDLFQFFLRLPDADVPNFLKLFTFLSLDEIENIVQNHMKNPDSRFGQRRLAEEVMLLVHGEEGLESARRATKAFYESDVESLTKMSANEIKQVLPSSSLVELPFEHGVSLLDLTLKAKCFLQEKDAHRIINGGGVYVNFQKLSSPNALIVPDIHILTNGTTLLRVGKKNYYLIAWK